MLTYFILIVMGNNNFFKTLLLLKLLVQPHMSKALLTILFLLPTLSFSQTDELVSSDKLQQDFSIYRKSLEEAHPGLYWYRTKAEMDSIFDASFDQLYQPMTERQFYTLLSSTTAKIGCLHTLIKPSDAYDEASINIDARPFPFEIKLDKNKMFVYQNLSNDTSITKGTEIISINDQKVSYLIPFLVDKISNDGYGDNWSRYVLERSFRYYYHVFIEEPARFKITFKDTNGNEGMATVPGCLEKERVNIIKERYPDVELQEPVISLKFDDYTNSAILRITRLDNWKIDGKKYKFRKTLKKKMKEILASGVSNLILDIGDHGGGNELWGLELLSYFLKKPYTAYKAVEFKTLDYKISKKYSNTSWLEYNLVKLFLHFERSDSTLHWKNYRGAKPYPPGKHGFNGDAYLLVGGSAASATSDFAAWVKELGVATIVGTETGGSYLGNTSNWELTIELPNTHIKLHLPLARYLTNVEIEKEEPGRGVVPDHIVPTTIFDKLNNVDTQLNYVLNLILSKEEK